MEHGDYYRKLRGLIALDQEIDETQIMTPSVAELRSGQVERGFIDLGGLLPQLSSDEIEELLAKFASTGQRTMGIVSIYYSDKVHVNGSNLHQTVQPAEWWKALLEKHFSKVQFIPSHRESELVWMNFRVSDGTRSRVAQLGKTSSARRELARLISRTKVAWRSFWGKCVTQDSLDNLLAGKTVAVVGNARSLNMSDFGREIDEHDIVIRFNRVPIVSRRSHGYRTSWVATGVPIGQDRMSSLGATHVLWLSRYRRKMPAETASVDNLYLHPIKKIDALAERSSVVRPTTGLVAIDLLSSSPARQISLYGFDFYQSQSSSSHQTIETAPHQFDREMAFVKSLVARDHRFVIR